MSDEQKSTFTSERDKVEDSWRVFYVDSPAFETDRDLFRHAFKCGADWGHARASEEITSLNRDKESLLIAIANDQIHWTADRVALQASQAREEGLRAALEEIAQMRGRLIPSVAAERALAAHGGGASDE